MQKLLSLLTISSLFSFGLATNRALAQLTFQQCNNDVNLILSARLNGSISQAEFAAISNQHHYEHPECGQYVSGSKITPEQLEMQRIRGRQHLEHMQRVGDRQVETFKNFIELME